MPTAEQAYIENLAWRAVNAPETIQANEQFAANQLAGAIDAAREQAKYIAAFSQSRSDLPTSYSPTFQSIQQQYESSRNRVVSGSGYVWQGEVKSSINPYPERSAAGIAWEVGRTGGSVDIGVAQRAIWEGAKPSEVLVAGIGGFGERINTSVQDLFTGASKIFGIEGVPIVQQQPASISTEQYMASLPTPFISTPSATPIAQQQQSFDLLNFLGLGGGAVGQRAFQSAVSGQHPAAVQQGGMGFGMPQYASDEIMRMSEGFGSAFWGGVGSIFGGGRGVSAGGGADIGSPMVQAPGIITEQKLPGTTTIYTPFGEYAQTAVEGAKLAIDPITGELGIYQQTRAGNWMLVGGGGRAAVQSGMFSVEKPLTPVVYTQESGGGKFAPSADLYMAERVLASPEAFSRLGAEAYGGFVHPLDSRTLTPESRVSTYSDIYNLANYAQPLGVNLGKAAAPGADIPWQLPAGAGAVSFMGPEGLTGVGASLPSTQYGERLVGGGKVAAMPEYTTTTPSAIATPEGLPSPFISSTTSIERGTGEIFGFKVPVVSDVLAFFQPQERVTSRLERTVTPEVTTLVGTEYSQVPGGTLRTDIYETRGGVVGTMTETRVGMGSPFDQWLSGANRMVSEGLGLSAIPTPTTEQIKGFAPFYTAFGMAPVGLALQTPVLGDYAASYLKGEATALKEQPVSFGISYGAGFAMGAIFKGVEAGVAAGRAATAERVISEAGIYRSADIFAGKVVQAAPVVLGGAYAADIGLRSTSYGTDFSPASAERLGGIMATEARPMFFGGLAGYAAPTYLYESAMASREGYNLALVEGRATGKFDYYISQPVKGAVESARGVATSVYDTAMTPVRRFQLEYPQLAIEEGKGTLGYLGYKFGQAPKYAEIVRPDLSYMEYETAGVYGKTAKIGDIFPKIESAVTSGYGRVKGSFQEIALDYAAYRAKTGAPYLTPQQKIDVALLGYEGKTGALQPERMYVFEKQTGEIVTTARGSLYDTADRRWMASVEEPTAKIETNLRDMGVEPFTVTKSKSGESKVLDYSNVQAYHTHTKGMDVLDAKHPWLEYPSRADIALASQSKSVEGIITPSGVMSYRFSTPVTVSAFARSKRAGMLAFAKTGESSAFGKAFAESLGRYGSAKGGIQFRTYEEIRASLPEGYDRVSGGPLGYIKSKVFPETNIAPEITRPLIESEMEFATGAVYGRTTQIGDIPRLAEISIKSWLGETPGRDFMTMLIRPTAEIQQYNELARIGRMVGPSTPEGGGAAAVKGGFGVAPAAAGRVTTSTFGGREIGRLSKEPSLQSMGIKETATPARGTTIGRSVSYGGVKRGGMEPLWGSKTSGKQTAIQLQPLSEQLPAVEGMPTTRMAPPTQVGVFALRPQIQGAVQVLEPQLEFTQQRQERGMAMALMPVSVSRAVPVLEFGALRFGQEIATRARQGQAYATFTAFAQEQRLGQRQEKVQEQARLTAQERGMRFAQDLSFRQDAFRDVARRFEFEQGRLTGTTQRTSQRQTTITTPYEYPYYKITPIPGTPVPGGAYFPSGLGGASGGARKRRAAFLETFTLGLDIGFMNRRPKRAKSYKSPKKPRKVAKRKK